MGLGGVPVPWPTDSACGRSLRDVGFDDSVTAAGIEHFRPRRRSCCRPRAARFVEARAGLRPATTDDLPIVGRSSTMRGVYYATGHYRNGVLLAPLNRIARRGLAPRRPRIRRTTRRCAGSVRAVTLRRAQGHPEPFDVLRVAPGTVEGRARSRGMKLRSITRPREVVGLTGLTGVSCNGGMPGDSSNPRWRPIVPRRGDSRSGVTTPLDVPSCRLADLRRRGFRSRGCGVCFNAAETSSPCGSLKRSRGGPMTLFHWRRSLYRRMETGRLLDLEHRRRRC